jgi:hypothetical protein
MTFSLLEFLLRNTCCRVRRERVLHSMKYLERKDGHTYQKQTNKNHMRAISAAAADVRGDTA